MGLLPEGREADRRRDGDLQELERREGRDVGVPVGTPYEVLARSSGRGRKPREQERATGWQGRGEGRRHPNEGRGEEENVEEKGGWRLGLREQPRRNARERDHQGAEERSRGAGRDGSRAGSDDDERAREARQDGEQPVEAERLLQAHSRHQSRDQHGREADCREVPERQEAHGHDQDSMATSSQPPRNPGCLMARR
ncbi:MAG: hypothetical protein K0S03_627 [Burkholderiales bacterium]|nr:hypothetical protein [Burkholderiales bacterium]